MRSSYALGTIISSILQQVSSHVHLQIIRYYYLDWHVHILADFFMVFNIYISFPQQSSNLPYTFLTCIFHIDAHEYTLAFFYWDLLSTPWNSYWVIFRTYNWLDSFSMGNLPMNLSFFPVNHLGRNKYVCMSYLMFSIAFLTKLGALFRMIF